MPYYDFREKDGLGGESRLARPIKDLPSGIRNGKLAMVLSWTSSGNVVENLNRQLPLSFHSRDNIGQQGSRSAMG